VRFILGVYLSWACESRAWLEAGISRGSVGRGAAFLFRFRFARKRGVGFFSAAGLERGATASTVKLLEQFVLGPNRRMIGAILFALLLAATPAFTDDKPGTSPTPRETAEAQFDRAQKLRAELEATPESQRTLAEYDAVVKAYRHVYLITPRAPDVPFAILTVGDLFRQMGDRFDVKYYQSAVDSYQYLLHEYPNSRYREDALFAVGQIQKDDLNDRALAQKTFEEFLQLHPHSPRAADAQLAITELTLHQSGKAGSPFAQPPAPAAVPSGTKAPAKSIALKVDSQPPVQLVSGQTFTEIMEQPTSGKIAELRDVKTWTTPDYTRIVINLDGPVRYQAARVPSPERIFFDVSQAHLSHTAANAPVEIQGDLLKSIRVAQNQPNTVRVVLEVGKIKDYSVFLLRDPYRMVVDVYAKPNSKVDPKPDNITTASNAAPAQSPLKNGSAGKSAVLKNAPASDYTAEAGKFAPDTGTSQTISNKSAAKNTTGYLVYGPPAPLSASLPQPRSNLTKANHTTAPSPAPAPTRDGQQSLSRALGLKIGRIVIDAGHGGHDTGTVGPAGLMEKDLCLDVALRLGQMIEDHLPGTEIIYTRSDDTFVPLEERTNIANQAKADLFISIHANSSPDPSARGVETYYLNFSPSPEAMGVAARENATAQNSVHDLDDIIEQIARNEKIEESKELAADIQDSLTKRLQRTNHSIRNRGVRKAPFVVLIGANMPSVLAEISFISNPSDESSLAKPEGRDHVAEGLYKGVEAYLQSTNSLAFNQAKATAGTRTTGLAQTGNQK
jgi:N-acetylmuramoyl-L-alanine amidase